MKKLTTTLINLVQLLNDGVFHSGSDLGEKLKISRNAVRKQINVLIEAGIAIESQQSKGYCLKQKLLLLDAKKIKKYFAEDNLLLGDLDIYRSVDSTNDVLKTKLIKDSRLMHVCLAEEQTAGKGRLGRQWVSPFGANIYLSLLHHYSKDISELSGLSLIVGLSIINALVNYGIKTGLQIKWPNDILYEGKKLAGILIEIQAESHSTTRIIIGIGLNVNLITTKEIDQPWTSVATILGGYHDRNKIISCLLTQLDRDIALFTEHGLSHFKIEWQKYDYLQNVAINVVHGKQVFPGIAQGINDHGHLLLKQSDGRLTAHSSGDASIKKS